MRVSVGDHFMAGLNLEFATLGVLKLKNIARPVEAFAVQLTDGKAAQVVRSSMPDHALAARSAAIAHLLSLS